MKPRNQTQLLANIRARDDGRTLRWLMVILFCAGFWGGVAWLYLVLT